MGPWQPRSHLVAFTVESLTFILSSGFSLLLDGLRREEETAFKGWLWTMGIFTPWKCLAWAFAGKELIKIWY